MKAAGIANADAVGQVFRNESRRSAESRYQHRLHGVLLVAKGLSCAEVAALLGDSVRSVQYWVRRYEKHGVVGLAEIERPGRPARLDGKQLQMLSALLRQPPSAVGLNAKNWSGKLLALFIERRWKAQLGTRQCQRLCQRFSPSSPGRYPAA